MHRTGQPMDKRSRPCRSKTHFVCEVAMDSLRTNLTRKKTQCACEHQNVSKELEMENFDPFHYPTAPSPFPSATTVTCSSKVTPFSQ